MTLWKVELYYKNEDKRPARWGVLTAESEQDAERIVQENMGDAWRADFGRVLISEITSLPEGTFFWKDHANRP